jgi:glutamate dehydrogenase/leucine dehydrogenase
VQITKLSNVDAFVVVDLEGADRATGIVRWAKKVLQDGAVNLARHVTYAAASLGLQVSGASAGINSDPDSRDAAVSAFAEEAAATGVRFDAGKGVSTPDLEPLAAADDRSPLHHDLHDQLLAVGQVAALRAVRGDLSGLSVAVEATVAGVGELTAALTSAGATVESVAPGTLDAACDVLCVGSKVGVVDHENVTTVTATTILPVAPLPITARGLATAGRAGITVVPDFLALAGPLLAAWPADDADAAGILAAADQQIHAAVTEVLGHAEGPLLGACVRAEEFLLTWRDELPFGRPIA